MEENNKMNLEEASMDLYHLIAKHLETSKSDNDVMNLKHLIQMPEFKHFEQAVNPRPSKEDFIKWLERFTHKCWVEEDQKMARHLIAYLKEPPKLRILMWFENTGKMPVGCEKALVKYKQGDYGVINIADAEWSLGNSIASIERFLIIE